MRWGVFEVRAGSTCNGLEVEFGDPSQSRDTPHTSLCGRGGGRASGTVDPGWGGAGWRGSGPAHGVLCASPHQERAGATMPPLPYGGYAQVQVGPARQGAVRRRRARRACVQDLLGAGAG